MKPPAKNTGGSLRAVKLNRYCGLLLTIVPPGTKRGYPGGGLPNGSRDILGNETLESDDLGLTKLRHKTDPIYLLHTDCPSS